LRTFQAEDEIAAINFVAQARPRRRPWPSRRPVGAWDGPPETECAGPLPSRWRSAAFATFSVAGPLNRPPTKTEQAFFLSTAAGALRPNAARSARFPCCGVDSGRLFLGGDRSKPNRGQGSTWAVIILSDGTLPRAREAVEDPDGAKRLSGMSREIRSDPHGSFRYKRGPSDAGAPVCGQGTPDSKSPSRLREAGPTGNNTTMGASEHENRAHPGAKRSPRFRRDIPSASRRRPGRRFASSLHGAHVGSITAACLKSATRQGTKIGQPDTCGTLILSRRIWVTSQNATRCACAGTSNNALLGCCAQKFLVDCGR